MRRWFTAAVLSVFLLAPFPAQAQEGTRFASVRVDIWPEYDRPAVLVITHVSLLPDTVLPAQLTLRIPTQATLWAVAEIAPSGDPVNAAYQRQNQGEWVSLEISANSLQVQVEYYDLLDKAGTTRHITYHWPGDAAVDAFSVDFLQPTGATNLVLSPPATSSMTNQGLTNYEIGPMQLESGEEFNLQAEYQKRTDDLSVSGMPVEPVQASPANPGSYLWNSTTGRLILLLGIGLLVAVGLIVLIKGQNARRQTAPRRRHGRSAEESDETAGAHYCRQCGKRAQQNDVFCRSCGARLS